MNSINNKDTWIIAGLGNPEQAYKHTRHNVGFDTLDALNTKKESWSRGQNCIFCVNWFHNAIMIKPTTGMNSSGLGIRDGIQSTGATDSSRVIIIHDDMDFEPGQIRIKVGGGDGKHNGLKSIINHIGKDFIRIRIGIGKPRTKEEGIDFVLERFNNRERARIDEAIQLATEAVTWIVQDGVQRAMNQFNQKER